MLATANFTTQTHTDLRLMVARTNSIARVLGIRARPAFACSRLHRSIEHFGWPMAGTSRVRSVGRLTTPCRGAGTESLIWGAAAVVAVAAAFPAVRSAAGKAGRYHHGRQGSPCQGLGAVVGWASMRLTSVMPTGPPG